MYLQLLAWACFIMIRLPVFVIRVTQKDIVLFCGIEERQRVFKLQGPRLKQVLIISASVTQFFAMVSDDVTDARLSCLVHAVEKLLSAGICDFNQPAVVVACPMN